MNKNNDGPDGITEVVPAPPRPVSSHKSPEPSTPEPPPKAADRTSTLPEVKITVPNSSRPTSLQASTQEANPVAETVQSKEPKESKDARDPKDSKNESRKSVIVGNDMKYLASLGIDAAILDSRSNEFAKWLDYFAWVPGDQMRGNNFDDMRLEMERELNKAQAGGWLARFQEEDERVEMIKRGVDVAMAECEELDNLLTLYSVELSVSVGRGSRRLVILLTLSRRLSPTTLLISRRKARVCRSRPPTRSS